MKLTLKKFEVATGRPIVFVSDRVAKSLDLHVGDRVTVSRKGRKIIARTDILMGFLASNEISLSEDIQKYLSAQPGDRITLSLVALPKSSQFIAKKMNGKSLSRSEIYSIIRDIVSNAITEVEVAQFVVAVYEKGMSLKETVYLTEAMYRTGSVLKWKYPIVADKHCIGGIAGNRTTPIVVSICAAAGLIFPKTSSRAITSAAGTADVVETLSKVDFPSSELQSIVKKVGACLAWGGSLGLAPADDKLIKVERALNVDPKSQLIASILSKKLAVGSNHILIDIPYGLGAKVSKEEALNLKTRFLSLARHFKLKMKVILTDGSQPIGNGIGPVLEMLDVLKVLKRENPPQDLEQKSVMLASQILEMTGRCKPSQGKLFARKLLDSGEAFKKFDEIIRAQGRRRVLLVPGKYKETLSSSASGKIKEISNKSLNHLASILGCPADKSAGVYLYRHVGDAVKPGEPLLTLYSESPEKLKDALAIYRAKPFIIIE